MYIFKYKNLYYIYDHHGIAKCSIWNGKMCHIKEYTPVTSQTTTGNFGWRGIYPTAYIYIFHIYLSTFVAGSSQRRSALCGSPLRSNLTRNCRIVVGSYTAAAAASRTRTACSTASSTKKTTSTCCPSGSDNCRLNNCQPTGTFVEYSEGGTTTPTATTTKYAFTANSAETTASGFAAATVGFSGLCWKHISLYIIHNQSRLNLNINVKVALHFNCSDMDW